MRGVSQFATSLPRVVATADENAKGLVALVSRRVTWIDRKMKRKKKWQGITYSLPVQYDDASEASQVTTPRISSGRPKRCRGLRSDHFLRS